jgi:lipoate-protein ligase A
MNLAIGIALPPGARMSITAAYDLVCAPIERALRTVPGLGRGKVERSFCDGDHNVTAGGRKLAGTAQRWRRSAEGTAVILAHALILHDCDIPAAVEAVNGLRAALGLGAEAVPDAHVNARGLQGCAYGDIDEFARAVGRAVDVTLTDALGRSRTAAENDEDALQEGQKLMATREMAA